MNLSGRAPKTHQSQWVAIVDVVENHREMVTHQFVGPNGRENYNKLWDELTVQLNSMGFGRKDSKKWQEVFAKWKSKVKIKAQEIVCGLKKTGGGGPLPQLTPVEERLMAIIGWRAVTGDENLEMGLNNSFTASQCPAEMTSVASPRCAEDKSQKCVQKENLTSVYLEVPPLISLMPSTSDYSSPTPIISCSSVTPSIATITPSSVLLETSVASSSLPQTPCRSSSNSKRPASENKQRKAKKKTSTLNIREERTLLEMHNEHLTVLNNINKNLERIANNQESSNILLMEFLQNARFK